MLLCSRGAAWTVDQFAVASVIVEDKIVAIPGSSASGKVCIGRGFVMAIEECTSPRRATRSNAASSRNAPNAVERVMMSECQPGGSAARGTIDSVDVAPPQALLDAVEDQRLSVLNVLDIVHSMSASFVDVTADPAPEICAAFALLEQEIRRVSGGLEEGSLRNAMRAIASTPHTSLSTATDEDRRSQPSR
jgi:hypothetical protein